MKTKPGNFANGIYNLPWQFISKLRNVNSKMSKRKARKRPAV